MHGEQKNTVQPRRVLALFSHSAALPIILALLLIVGIFQTFSLVNLKEELIGQPASAAAPTPAASVSPSGSTSSGSNSLNQLESQVGGC